MAERKATLYNTSPECEGVSPSDLFKIRILSLTGKFKTGELENAYPCCVNLMQLSVITVFLLVNCATTSSPITNNRENKPTFGIIFSNFSSAYSLRPGTILLKLKWTQSITEGSIVSGSRTTAMRDIGKLQPPPQYVRKCSVGGRYRSIFERAKKFENSQLKSLHWSHFKFDLCLHKKCNPNPTLKKLADDAIEVKCTVLFLSSLATLVVRKS